MMPTIQQAAASLTRKAASDLVAAAKATPEDKAVWQPFAEAWPILEQLVECCLTNKMWAGILQTHVHALLPEGEADQAYQELDTLAKAAQQLQETSAGLATVIESLPDQALPVIVAFSWQPEAGKPVAECCFHACWNMTYHLGQISYIQTLYGDQEEHGDAGPFG